MIRPCGCGERGRHRKTCRLWRQPAAFEHHDPLSGVEAKIPPPEQQLLGEITSADEVIALIDRQAIDEMDAAFLGIPPARAKKPRPPKKVFVPVRSKTPAWKCTDCGNRQLRFGICNACGRSTLRELNI